MFIPDMLRLLPVVFLQGCVCIALAEPILNSGILPGTCRSYADSHRENSNITDYPFHQTAHTNRGIVVDNTNEPIDFVEVDRKVDEVEKCLGVRISRCGLRIKVAPDWVDSPVGQVGQVFPCRSQYLWCHGAEQYPATAIVTQDLGALKEEVIHIVTGADDPLPTKYAKCL